MILGQKKNTPLSKRFFDKVMPEPNTGCWLWIGAINESSYGSMRVNKKTLLAHRISFELHSRPIPKGKLVLHRCDNSLCVNPAHLYIGTDSDNTKDKLLRGRMNSKLSFALSKEIISNYSEGLLSQKDIGVKYGVSQTLISQIIRGKIWRLC